MIEPTTPATVPAPPPMDPAWMLWRMKHLEHQRTMDHETMGRLRADLARAGRALERITAGRPLP